MAHCLRMATVPSVSCFSSSSLSSPKRRSFRVINCSKLPHVNPSDLSPSMLDSGDMPLNRHKNSDYRTFSDEFCRPRAMTAYYDYEETSYSDSYSEQDSEQDNPPPDLESIILADRVIFLGMPLVSAVTELIVAQFMYLQDDDPDKSIQLHINSSGTTRADGEVVAREHEGFAIYDTMMQMTCEIHTFNLALAMGHACLFLAAGTKGKRFSLLKTRAIIQQPRALPSGLGPSSDVLVHAKEVAINKDNFIRLFAWHTGNSEETVANTIAKGTLHMNPDKAIEFGVIDQIYYGAAKKKERENIRARARARARAREERKMKKNKQREEKN
ncbi:ATP-dependent Clp protease proteolytic subunit-related protein 3- chloroplastic [Striga hermonthica]|uniref:ATP-dependent Clp protease proteolytic subunit n=1 Tax=Striga hermonthica TaxID=68872 RepID=A0A9N7RCF6_STRHE|nr:ATP-dependent Clp protease proteolytic subunit-related protein 3- chloroplastic [Striga hermonthica]